MASNRLCIGENLKNDKCPKEIMNYKDCDVVAPKWNGTYTPGTAYSMLDK